MLDTILGDLGRLLPGLQLSVEITVVVVVIGLPLGFGGGLLLTSRSRLVRYPIIALVEILRGFPALLILYLSYFGLPAIHVVLNGFSAAVVAFTFVVAAYTAEIFRAAITSVPRGQLEAARALALRQRKITRFIVLPHVLNVAVPPVLGVVVIAFQGTSLALAVGVTELTGKALSFGQMTSTILEQSLIAGALYLILTSLLTWMEVIAERRARRFTRAGARSTKERRRTSLDTIPTP